MGLTPEVKAPNALPFVGELTRTNGSCQVRMACPCYCDTKSPLGQPNEELLVQDTVAGCIKGPRVLQTTHGQDHPHLCQPEGNESGRVSLLAKPAGARADGRSR